MTGHNYVGGIVGSNTNGRYSYCSNSGKVKANMNAGGIAGCLYPGTGVAITVNKCYNTGEIVGNTAVGGIAGGIANPTVGRTYIHNSYNTGMVHGIVDYVGGICGVLAPWRGVENCYSVGKVTCDNPSGKIGGIVGLKDFLTSVIDCYYLDTSISNSNTYGAPKKHEEMMLQSTFAGFDFANGTWYFGDSTYKYPKLAFPNDNVRYYAKVIVVDGFTGQAINDYELKIESNNDNTLNCIPSFADKEWGVLLGEYSAFTPSTSITISKDGYKEFTFNANELQISNSLQLAKNNIIYLIPSSSSDLGDNEIDYQTYILEHVDFAKEKHDYLVKNKGFQNAYWTFDNGEEFTLATIGNWLDNVNSVISINFGDIKFEADYYDLFLSDLILAMVDLKDSNIMNASAFEAYNKYYSKISNNWIATFKYLDANKEDLLSTEERQAWNSIVNNLTGSDGQVDWTLVKGDINNLLSGASGKYEIDEATEDLLTFIVGDEFLSNNREIFTDVFEGLDIANEVCEYLINASNSINGFQSACQAYISASTVDVLYDEFFTVLDKAVAEMSKKDFNSAEKFRKVIKKYQDSAQKDSELFIACANELLKSTIAFTYDSFAKSYATKIAQTSVAKLLGVPAGAVSAATLAYKLGYMISDYATGMSSKTENYTFMYYVAPFEAALETVSKQYAEELLDKRTYENAKNYDCTYRMLSITNKYLYNCWYKIGASGLPIDIGDMHLGQLPEIMELSASYLNVWEANKCHGTGNVISNKYKYTSIQCPVDVYVYDSNDNLLASIVNEEVKKNSEELYILVSDEKKTIIYPADKEYKITIVPRESGSMDYYVAEISDDDIRNIDFYSIPIEEKVQYNGKIPAQFHAEAIEYALSSSENKEEADYDSNEKDKCLATPESLTWENRTAKWNSVDYAKEYIVYLYKDGELLETRNSKEPICKFDSQIKSPGAYTFCVVACGDQSSYENSRKSGHSEILRVNEIGTEGNTDSNTKPKPSITKSRVAGENRFKTAINVAEQLKVELGITKFQNIVVANSDDYADALSATALAADREAPILVVNKNNEKTVKNYIDKNLINGGKVYIIGETAAVSKRFEDSLTNCKVIRLGGADRFATNIAVLKELKMTGASDIMVAYGHDFADALSASATGNPILLVGDSLTDMQKTYLATLGRDDDYYVIGGTAAVNTTVMNQLKASKLGDVVRLAGVDRYETGLVVAEEFFGTTKSVVIASGNDFPDGLTGGVLANVMNSPLMLVNQYNTDDATGFIDGNSIKSIIAIGGTAAISDTIFNTIA